MCFHAVVLSLVQAAASHCVLSWDKNGETLVKCPGSDGGDCGSQLQQGYGGGTCLLVVVQPAEAAPWK
jgi:hypothetical protein